MTDPQDNAVAHAVSLSRETRLESDVLGAHDNPDLVENLVRLVARSTSGSIDGAGHVMHGNPDLMTVAEQVFEVDFDTVLTAIN